MNNKIFNHYKFDHQVLKLAEECGELIQACIKLSFNKTPENESKFKEELADVANLIEQFEYYYNGDIYIIKFKKQKRQIERIKTGGIK